MKPKLSTIFFLAIAIRLLFIFFQYSGDVKNHLAWADSVIKQGSLGLYTRHFPGFNDVNYPPLTISFFSLSRFAYNTTRDLVLWQNFNFKFLPSVSVHFVESENVAAGFMKLPAILADLGIGYLIFKLTQKKLLAILYLFNPAVIYVSSVWGQIESIPIFFLVLSFYLLPKRYYLSHIAFVLAILSKQTALWLLPVYLVMWVKHRGVKKLLRGLTLQVIVFILLYLPFISSLNPFPLYLATLSGSSTLVSDQAMNLWYFIFQGARLTDSIKLLGISARIWSLSLLALSYLYICARLWRRFSIGLAANSLFFLSLAAFFLQTRVHERHLAPALPFLLLTTFKPKTKVTLYAFISAYHLFNLYTGLRLPFLW